ncbi:MAG TPA: CpaD family pilus assembly lipoprotein [Stellaceae bacterium]|nr:CpaD family pilus assembly lipoprotein [Stellaceae bacterium]
MTKSANHPRHPWMLAAAFVTAALLTGCTHAPNDVTLNQITVKPVQLSHTVHFAPGSATLAPAEAADLETFLGEDRRDGIDGVTIIAGNSTIADARRARVSQALDNLGFVHRMAAPDPSFAADAVVVTVNREAAVPPACPNWTIVGPYDPSNAPSTNLGCATRTDLYLMVADPRDLVSGHPQGPADAAPSMAAVATYRTGKPAADLGSADGSGGASTGGAGGGGGGGGSMTSAGGGYGQ